jgi:1-aminocyclopropane-1-carboxylate deaminase/D-cysteine desulfhydrase-like pyridoxal-dependent ACC family enzyme
MPETRTGAGEGAASEVALFEAYPRLRESLAWEPLGRYPTPVTPMPELARAVGIRGGGGGGGGGGNEIWIKRDDQSAELYGGNKVRKLEFVLAEAVRRGHRRVWTMGGFGSHQVLANSLYARVLGLDCAAVVFPQPMTDHVRQVLAEIRETDCELVWAHHMLTAPVAAARLVARFRLRDGRVPLQVPPGASSPLGALGYVSAALELVAQIRRGECPRPEVVFTAMGSLGTAAGLMVGFRLSGMDIPVRCVRVVLAPLAPVFRLAALCRATAAVLRHHGVEVPGTFRTSDMVVEPGFVGEGYGYVTPEGQVAVAAAAADSIHLETTYTGKALAGLMAYVRQRRVGWRNVLFWNTFASGHNCDSKK